ncbi:MAG: diaminopropionate ammonia-lyase [Candidatus Marinimicrobia bacterium]|nr:diaminopropionate ammonia-lyase [Candidatus Neomarinimicrobiota bacterium]|tara:strand:- start:668 stop:1792 length:1125 start_codon:yes stop_codon:yes gene_type:complete
MKIITNPHFGQSHAKIMDIMDYWDPEEIYRFHQGIGNKETPLIKLPELAKTLGIANILVKDESCRLGLSSFKPLGASYAIYKEIQRNSQIRTFCTATDGNHGRSVAWMARKLKKRAVVYVPSGTASERIKHIKQEGAEVEIVEGGYDDTVRKAMTRCEDENLISENEKWALIQDTAWNGYERIPLNIMKGYWTQIHEITKQLKNDKIDILILQLGVGSWAASIIGYIIKYWKNIPLIISIEPFSANCLYESIKLGERVSINKDESTIMAGLNCGTVSLIAWDILKKYINQAISISDRYAEEAMRILARPFLSDQPIIAGESGASGLGGLLALFDIKAKEQSNEASFLDRSKTVLIINTEGNTDPISYNNIITAS